MRIVQPIAGTLGALLLLSGVANAQLPKQEQKCANSINKGAAKVAKAQAGDNASCVKNGGKGKLTTSIEACLTGDVKGKVAKAISKIKTSDCTGGAAPSFLPGLQTSSSEIGDIMKQKDLDLIHAIFGTDLDVFIVDAGVDKPGAGCQAAIAKAAGKCEDAKLGSFNSCKKDKLKAGDTDIQACLGSGTGGIPDGKGKIAKKCGNGLGGTVGKKCAGTDNAALFPPCAGGDLGDCLDQKIECEVCRALNLLDGLNRDCDLFDDGLANGSCEAVAICGDDLIQPSEECDPPSSPCEGGICSAGCACVPLLAIGSHATVQDPTAFCEDEPNTTCNDVLFGTDCASGDCIAAGSHSIISNPTGIEIPFLLEGEGAVECDVVDPDTGIAACRCSTGDLVGQDVSVLGALCFRARPDLECDDGIVDCDGGAPMDQELVLNHNIGPVVNNLDPQQFPVQFCGLLDPNRAHEECSDMCDLYCPTLGASFIQTSSNCEGFCVGGPLDGISCTLHSDCCVGQCTLDDGACSGGSLVVPHRNVCHCNCLAQGIGAPGRPGALRCEAALQAWIESDLPCDQLDISIILLGGCVPLTTESSIGRGLNSGNQTGVSFDAVALMGEPGGRTCVDLAQSVTSGGRTVGHTGTYDSTIGDVFTNANNVNK